MQTAGETLRPFLRPAVARSGAYRGAVRLTACVGQSVLWASAILIAVIGAAILGGLVSVAGVADPPDEARKAHDAVVPTCGGVAVIAAASLGLAIASAGLQSGGLLSDQDAAKLGWTWAFAVAAGALGLADDLFNLSAKLKFAIFAAASVAFAVFVARVEAIGVTPRLVLELGLAGGVVGTALWLFTIANAINFMDGANGLALGSSAIGLAGLALYAALEGAGHVALAAIILAAAIVGFLPWNVPRARVFAGDCGALFVGAGVGGVGVLAIVDAGLSVWMLPVLFMPLLADVLLTLEWRRRRGKTLLAAHRDHLYQVGLRAKVPHWQVSLVYWLAMAHCTLAAAAGWLFGDRGAFAAFLVSAVLAVFLSRRVRQFEEVRGIADV